jgi:hypothetical protein
MSFNQGSPGVSQILNTANCLVFGNTSTGNALSVQQLGAGNVFVTSNTNGTIGLFVNPSSNVGIGITSPAQKFHVYSAAAGNPTNTGTGADSNALVRFQFNTIGLDFGCLNNGNTWIQNRQPTTSLGTSYPLLINPLGGNVGIGTTNPGNLLTVNNGTTDGTVLRLVGGNGASTAVGPSIDFSISNLPTYTGASIKSLNLFTDGGGQGAHLAFYTSNWNGTSGSNSERMRITSGGNVGIGTASPGYTLDCYTGTVQATTFRSLSGNYLYLVNGAGGSAITLQGTTTAISGGAVIMTGGNVGIGTTNPTFTLHVNGSIGSAVGSNIPITLPPAGSFISYGITLATSGTWYTIISDARINATITGAIGTSDLTSTVFIVTLLATGQASANMTIVTGSASNIRTSGAALQFLASSSSYGLACNFTLLRHS